MCLVLLALDSHPVYSVVLAANRDEFYDRPTAPAVFWDSAPSILGGRDLKAGGTWLGVSRTGRLAAVTNFRQGEREQPAPRSRGHLVADFLTGSTGTPQYMERVRAESQLYNGFNLIAGDSGGFFYYSNREGAVRRLGPGVFGLSNHLLDTPWPKVAAAKSGFGELLESRGSEQIERLFALLSDRSRPPDDLLPSTGVSREWERLLSSAFIVSDGYGTRSSTVVLIGRDGNIVFVERTFGPNGEPDGETRFKLNRS
jgi:uncharacterized protein with NRDE domain